MKIVAVACTAALDRAGTTSGVGSSGMARAYDQAEWVCELSPLRIQGAYFWNALLHEHSTASTAEWCWIARVCVRRGSCDTWRHVRL